MTFSEADLRKWEACKLHGLPLPDIPPDDLITLWQQYGFDPQILEPLRKKFSAWQAKIDGDTG